MHDEPLDVLCPTCSAAKGDVCRTRSGQAREPHKDRAILAVERRPARGQAQVPRRG
jgi:hypothetical protein